jgi:tripartite-type tricarboxylate transporter receptor subunit TctC
MTLPVPPTFGRRAVLALGGAALALGGVARARPALAQRFPDQPIRMLTPWAPGGTTDTQMRVLCQIAARHLGVPIVVDNKPGAGGIFGAQALARGAEPDGYTLSQMPISVFRYPHTAARPTFDPMSDFTWILQLTGYLFGVVVRAQAPWQNFGELLAHAKANPGTVTYGTPGAGTSPHITMERIAGGQGIEWVHVPYRGTSENVQALLGGHIDVAADASGWGELVKDGRLRLLVTWGAERARRFPDAPTLRELGIDIVSLSTSGLAGPKGMDPAVVQVLHDAFKAALEDPEHLALLERYDMSVAYLNSADYAAAARRQHEEEGAMVRRLGLQR